MSSPKNSSGRRTNSFTSASKFHGSSSLASAIAQPSSPLVREYQSGTSRHLEALSPAKMPSSRKKSISRLAEEEKAEADLNSPKDAYSTTFQLRKRSQNLGESSRSSGVMGSSSLNQIGLGSPGLLSGDYKSGNSSIPKTISKFRNSKNLSVSTNKQESRSSGVGLQSGHSGQSGHSAHSGRSGSRDFPVQNDGRVGEVAESRTPQIAGADRSGHYTPKANQTPGTPNGSMKGIRSPSYRHPGRFLPSLTGSTDLDSWDRDRERDRDYEGESKLASQAKYHNLRHSESNNSRQNSVELPYSSGLDTVDLRATIRSAHSENDLTRGTSHPSPRSSSKPFNGAAGSSLGGVFPPSGRPSAPASSLGNGNIFFPNVPQTEANGFLDQLPAISRSQSAPFVVDSMGRPGSIVPLYAVVGQNGQITQILNDMSSLQPVFQLPPGGNTSSGQVYHPASVQQQQQQQPPQGYGQPSPRSLLSQQTSYAITPSQLHVQQHHSVPPNFGNVPQPSASVANPYAAPQYVGAQYYHQAPAAAAAAPAASSTVSVEEQILNSQLSSLHLNRQGAPSISAGTTTSNTSSNPSVPPVPKSSPFFKLNVANDVPWSSMLTSFGRFGGYSDSDWSFAPDPTERPTSPRSSSHSVSQRSPMGTPRSILPHVANPSHSSNIIRGSQPENPDAVNNSERSQHNLV